MNHLVCNNLNKKYGSKHVLQDINLTLEQGKIYGLIGRNGAGKTTLLSILSAQNPASSGTITLGNEPVWENQKALDQICFSREINPIAKGSGGGNGFTGLKIKEYLKVASIYFPNWDKEMADRLVKEFELNVKDRIIKLSKGMMSMVTIITAMASKAQFTFLDEPVAGLDVIMREYFYKILLEEYTQTGRTFVISTHIIEEAADVFEEVIMIKDGKVLLKEDTQQLVSKAFRVSGKVEDVDAATMGLACYQEAVIGRGKSVTVLVEKGQKIRDGIDVTVQPLNLQNVFVALCGKGEKHD